MYLLQNRTQSTDKKQKNHTADTHPWYKTKNNKE